MAKIITWHLDQQLSCFKIHNSFPGICEHESTHRKMCGRMQESMCTFFCTFINGNFVFFWHSDENLCCSPHVYWSREHWADVRGKWCCFWKPVKALKYFHIFCVSPVKLLLRQTKSLWDERKVQQQMCVFSRRIYLSFNFLLFVVWKFGLQLIEWEIFFV